MSFAYEGSNRSAPHSSTILPKQAKSINFGWQLYDIL
jgi:hypothetical protein